MSCFVQPANLYGKFLISKRRFVHNFLSADIKGIRMGNTGRDSRQNRVPGWLSASLVMGAFGLLWLFEHRRPLRRETESKVKRTGRNLAVAGLAAVSLQLVEKPIIQWLTVKVQRRRWGLLNLFHLPTWLEVVLTVVLMDYTLYVWHVLMHRVPVLWRFHLPHHADLDLDASTAFRFHAGELVISTNWRALQVLLIGPSPFSLSVWQTFVLLSILFHHSNVGLPLEFEQKLNRIFVTPRMHGIHHSIVEQETNSNWSSGLTIWDWLHGTLRLNVPQDKITIGVPAYQRAPDINLGKVIAMPFVEQRPTWLLPGNGKPEREIRSVPTNQLMP
jgi:sterol desaturase/sphingolipid hydroxylase (fatty acid hydroxylase superfamily)